jgi:uncharacterized protein
MFDDDGISNPSTNASFGEVCEKRRAWLKGSAAVGAVSILGAPLLPGNLRGADAMGSRSLLAADAGAVASPTFKSVPVSFADTVVVPEGYVADALIRWGDPISAGPAFKPDASNTAAEQSQQWGMHNDGMWFFPMIDTQSGRMIGSSKQGILVSNHEYADDGLLHTDGMNTWTAAKVAKSKAAHGVGIIEIAEQNGKWNVLRPSKFARRITADTIMQITGPAAGHELMKTADDRTGQWVLGTINNCANGYTPWGTYLTCEENFNGYFVNRAASVPVDQRRLGINDKGGGYRWHEFDERFDAAKHPQEPNRFGWVVEIDPFDPESIPLKRTALGRFKHEGATVALAPDNRVVVYMGDDERFEYIYKFVSRDAFQPGNRTANMKLLDHGTLYAAKYNADGSGQWLPLVHGQNGLTADNGFNDQAEVCIKARMAADRVGATKMDRPEWVAVNPVTKQVAATLTNNSQRGTEGRAAIDAVNPRAENTFGHIVGWFEKDNDFTATTFRWDIIVQAGDPNATKATSKGNIKGDMFGCPDGLWADARGILWVQTDISSSIVSQPRGKWGEFESIGNNAMLALDAKTGEYKRFLTGPVGCEITGVTMTPDMKTIFVNIQHPGETASERSDPANPKAISSWPEGSSGGRPRSATLAIRRTDGGVIGS